MDSLNPKALYYTIPRNNRELQLDHKKEIQTKDYTIPRNNRELQRGAMNEK